ncbi:MAG TPA: hypothetical protein VF665_22060 [Longimicrobium sp.]|jgi:hypothetical protein|uniref:hypothetical protein n=1 Tax=Longimicrobium sp. TaxID=2029185 RepID=UPI002EDB2901
MNTRTALLATGLSLALAACADGASTPLAPDGKPSADLWNLPTVSLSCHIDGQTCSATASGGSGSGYSFQWTHVIEQEDADGASWGNVDCYPYWGWKTVQVEVTDDANRTGYASMQFFCPA